MAEKSKPTTTTQKHSNFVSEPMGTKSVRDVPGIGTGHGRQLENKGYHTASEMLGQLLVSKRDPVVFKGWLEDATGANSRTQTQAYNGLNEWVDNNM